jgi:hypothetical protein
MKGFENGKQGSSRIAQTYIPEPNKPFFLSRELSVQQQFDREVVSRDFHPTPENCSGRSKGFFTFTFKTHNSPNSQDSRV